MSTTLELEKAAQKLWHLRKAYQGPAIHEILLSNEFADTAQQQSAQNLSLRKMLEHCYDAVPFYRERFLEAGINRRQLRDVTILQQLPILSKSAIEANFDSLQAQYLMSKQKMVGTSRSSGTTGQPTVIVQSDTSASMFPWLKQRELRWYRYDPMATMLSIRPSIELPRQPNGDLLQNEDYLKLRSWPYLGDLFETGESWAFNNTNGVKDQVRLIEQLKPRYLLMQSAGLEHLSMQQISEDTLNTLDAVQAISQTLTSIMRSNIEAALCVPVHQNYGLNEIGLVASRCVEGNRYHVHSEHCVVEIINKEGQPCSPGEYGKLLVTSLTNSAMPLLRYDADDLVQAVEGPCSCGRSLPSFGAIQGRYRRIAQLPEGTFPRWAAIQQSIYDFVTEQKSSVTQYQLYQNRDGGFELRIDCREEYFELLSTKIKADFVLAVDDLDAPALEIIRTSNFIQSESPKFQDFISEFAPKMDQ